MGEGDAHPESDIDLLVLDSMDSPWEELERMDDVLWRHSFENGTVICAVPVSEAAFEQPELPMLIRAKVEGKAVA